MSNIRLFFSNTLSANMTDRLDKFQSHYLVKVMRIKESEVFSIFNQIQKSILSQIDFSSYINNN